MDLASPKEEEEEEPKKEEEKMIIVVCSCGQQVDWGIPFFIILKP